MDGAARRAGVDHADLPHRIAEPDPRRADRLSPWGFAALLTDAAEAHGWDSNEVLDRAVLDVVGLRQSDKQRRTMA
jgi:hypothetical protein